MRKLIIFLVTGMLWCNFSNAEKFTLSCEGVTNEKHDYSVGETLIDQKRFYEDLEILVWQYEGNKKILEVKILSSSHWLLRDIYYTKKRNSIEVIGDGTIIKMGSRLNKREEKKEYLTSSRTRLSLTNRTYVGSMLINIADDSGNYVDYYVDFSAECSGTEKLLAYLGQEIPGGLPIDDNEIIAAASGTGFIVSRKGHVISNHHVIDGCITVNSIYEGKEYKSEILATDKINDLVLLKTDLKPKKVYSVSNDDPELLENVIIAGYPLGKKISSAIKATSGTVTALAGFGNNFSEFQTDAALNAGNSGGPIIDEEGNVIGVAVSKIQKEGIESFNFGIKASVLKTFAKANGFEFLPANYKKMKKKDLGFLITNATVYLDCLMTGKQIKKMIADENSRKAFYTYH